MKLHGVYTAIITPFAHGRVDIDALKRLVERQIEAGVSGIVPVGTTGESPTLSHKEQMAVIDTVVRQCHKRVAVIAGCGSNSTAKAIETTKEAKEIGVDASLQVAPYYNKPNQHGLYRHFCSIADAVDLPMVVYNIPGRSAVNISTDTMIRLFGHQNIIAVKEASGDLGQVMDVVSRLPQGRYVLSGDDSLAYPIVALGGHGVISVASNLLPHQVTEMITAALRRTGISRRCRRTIACCPYFAPAFTIPIPYR